MNWKCKTNNVKMEYTDLKSALQRQSAMTFILTFLQILSPSRLCGLRNLCLWFAIMLRTPSSSLKPWLAWPPPPGGSSDVISILRPLSIQTDPHKFSAHSLSNPTRHDQWRNFVLFSLWPWTKQCNIWPLNESMFLSTSGRKKRC